MFGVAGLMLGSGYLLEGLSLLSPLANAFLHKRYNNVLWWSWIVSLDFMSAAALAVSAVGLLFVQLWAKTAWLCAVSIMVFLHLSMVALYQAGPGVTTFYLVFTSIVVLVALMSWWFFTAPSADSTEASPANSESL